MTKSIKLFSILLGLHGTCHAYHNSKVLARAFHNTPISLIKMQIYNPRYDTAFKVLFSDPEITKHFINTVMASHENYSPVVKIHDKNPSDHKLQGRTIHNDCKLLLECEDSTNKRFLLEMQKSYQKGHHNRWLYYAARDLCMTAEDIKSNNEYYSKLIPVKTISILGFDEGLKQNFPNTTDPIVHLDMREQKTKKLFNNLLSCTYVIPSREPDANASDDLKDWLDLFKGTSWCEGEEKEQACKMIEEPKTEIMKKALVN